MRNQNMVKDWEEQDTDRIEYSISREKHLPSASSSNSAPAGQLSEPVIRLV